ncbi:IS5/IS1182 family transposase [Paracoccus denitrificans]|jgi:hypothetical protein|uniref:Transposase DDE domain-containing protein n=1 Tax=Paracoccus denitrificans (strain Pd 1222) TaxID=318586 RepID=A1AZ65_PARDP|nr:IS5/IS1182 family transposase [Paracoccus denitrificans]ABL68559.1 hypothetical protein Pden_0445 [Paracoccus denitrificans PD1222]MBB4625718.1 hypothetical protein [Paracoccus denitrificans]MCU7427116.1 IS5/IS1182 family transposase [Paracoccus denitrificans]QAR26626.1 IS5/IS1182 family transposase [Paracoccus denitrificans]UPV95572.1 IS5/IS1182 family transposase [Paracoccus denitrificans]
MSRPTPPTYKTRNWPAYNEALKRRGSLTIWFDTDTTWDAVPTGRRGRQQTYSDAAIQTCLSMKALFGMALRGAAAVIPPRKNAKPWKPNTPGVRARNEALRASKYLGRALWRNWSGYHRRSRVESKMHCVKLLGQRLMARDFDRQVAEIQIRIAVLNDYTALGIPVTEAVG